MQVSTPSVCIASHGSIENSIGQCIFKEKLLMLSRSDFVYCPHVVFIFPGFEKLPVVAFTFGVISASCVQECRIQNGFLVHLFQMWTPLMNCLWGRENGCC